MKFLTTQLSDIPWVRHGFFSRRGGVSEGLYKGLNCGPGSGDKPDHVRANRIRAAEMLDLPPDAILTVHQVHSPDAVYAAEAWPAGKAPEADAIVTDRPDLGIAILTADCAPVLFASQKDKVIGAAHAGWKGALFGVLESTVGKMRDMGVDPGDISAAIGPCIGPASYEVSENFAEPFLKQAQENEQFFQTGKPGHLYFDLPGYVGHRLRLAGVGHVRKIRGRIHCQRRRFITASGAARCAAKRNTDGRFPSSPSVRNDFF